MYEASENQTAMSVNYETGVFDDLYDLNDPSVTEQYDDPEPVLTAIPGDVVDAHTVHGAIQWQAELGALPYDRDAVQATEDLARSVLLQRISASMMTAHEVTLAAPEATIFDIDEGEMIGRQPFTMRETVLNDAEADDAVPMSPEDLFDDEDDDVDVDLGEALHLGAQELRQDITAMDPTEDALEMARSNYRSLAQSVEAARQPEAQLTPDQLEIAIKALNLQYDTVPAEDNASRVAIADTLRALGADTAALTDHEAPKLPDEPVEQSAGHEAWRASDSRGQRVIAMVMDRAVKLVPFGR